VIGVIILGIVLAVSAVYASDVIENYQAGKTGLDAWTPTSSLGTYIGAGIFGGLTAGLSTLVVSCGYMGFTAIGLDVFFGAFSNVIGDGIGALIDNQPYGFKEAGTSLFYGAISSGATSLVKFGVHRFNLNKFNALNGRGKKIAMESIFDVSTHNALKIYQQGAYRATRQFTNHLFKYSDVSSNTTGFLIDLMSMRMGA